ncbi:hypothetical protein [Neorhodopirellula lusitana]|uniref:hypothetical protein n=1 Tax=Neorhodopirellula lusitana TaxID=445327 RepID=UPI0024B77581|nr:hypothetical protein [Neorhodopirellula lusitana]
MAVFKDGQQPAERLRETRNRKIGSQWAASRHRVVDSSDNASIQTIAQRLDGSRWQRNPHSPDPKSVVKMYLANLGRSMNTTDPSLP